MYIHICIYITLWYLHTYICQFTKRLASNPTTNATHSLFPSAVRQCSVALVNATETVLLGTYQSSANVTCLEGHIVQKGAVPITAMNYALQSEANYTTLCQANGSWTDIKPCQRELVVALSCSVASRIMIPEWLREDVWGSPNVQSENMATTFEAW